MIMSMLKKQFYRASKNNYLLFAIFQIVHGPERAGDIPHSLASIEKAMKLLDYKPTHNIERGIKESIDYY